MNDFICLLIFITSLPRKIINKLLNLFVSSIAQSNIQFNWTDLQIVNPRNIHFLGSFAAGRGLWIEAIGVHSNIIFGDGARLSDWVHITAVGKITLGKNILIGSKVIITDHSHGFGYKEMPSEVGIPPAERILHSNNPVNIGDNVWLGDNVVILAGANIGDNCVIGANSLVKGFIPSNTVCAGNPAKILYSV